MRKRTGAGLPAPVRLRVANPRQGDFAKPDCKKRRRASGIPPTQFTGEQTDLFQHSDEGFGCCAVSCPFGYCSTRYRNGASRWRDRPSDRCWRCRSTGVMPYDLVRGANGLSQLEHREPRQLRRNSFPPVQRAELPVSDPSGGWLARPRSRSSSRPPCCGAQARNGYAHSIGPPPLLAQFAEGD